jgi:hypothetical protein
VVKKLLRHSRHAVGFNTTHITEDDMKAGSRIGIGALFAILLVVIVVWSAPAVSADAPPKITICHAATAHYVAITVSLQSGDLSGELAKTGHYDDEGNLESGHEQDFVLFFDGDREDCEKNAPPPDEK